MTVSNQREILDFVREYPDSQRSLDSWLNEALRQTWANPNQMRQSFPSASLVNPWTVFNIAGNKYRMIARILYADQIVFIARIMTHKEYDKDQWK